jgi:predicted RNA-binding protein YlxR (DUF448 family)
VGCGAKADPTELLRLTAAEGRVVPDVGRRLGGRGAWLHRDVACLAQAIRRKAFGRVLRSAGLAVDGEELGRLLTGVARRD